MKSFQIIALVLSLAGCSGADGAPGAAGKDGAAGTPGAAGTTGATGPAGASGEAGAAAPVSDVVLPGGFFFPESITSDPSGRLFVSSAGTGSINVIAADGRAVTELVAAEPVSATVAIAKLGLLVDAAYGDLYACTVNTQTFASTLRRYDLATGAKKDSFDLAKAGGVCNDLALDAKGNLYVTDSFFGIERLAAGSSKLEVWKEDALFTAGPGQFAVDGIVVDGEDIYVNNLTSGALVRVPIHPDGAAGTPVSIALAAPLSGPDGMRLAGAHTLLVAESGADAVGQVKIDPATNTAVRTTFANRIDRPSSVAIAGDGVFITEGQIGRLFGLEKTAVDYPFYVRRIPLH